MFGLIVTNDKIIDIDLKKAIEKIGIPEETDDFIKNSSSTDINQFYIKYCYDLFEIDEKYHLNVEIIKKIVDYLLEYSKISMKYFPLKVSIFATESYHDRYFMIR